MWRLRAAADSSLFSVAATSLHKDTETQEPLFKCSPSTLWPQVGSILVLAFEAAFDEGIRVFQLPAITCCCWPLPASSFQNFVSISISLVWRLGMGICIFKILVPTAVCCCTVADFYFPYISSCVSRAELSKVSAGVWPLDPRILVTWDMSCCTANPDLIKLAAEPQKWFRHLTTTDFGSR